MSYRTNLRHSDRDRDHRHHSSDRRPFSNWKDERDRPGPFQKGGFPPPQGKHTRFTDDSDGEFTGVAGGTTKASWDRDDSQIPGSQADATHAPRETHINSTENLEGESSSPAGVKRGRSWEREGSDIRAAVEVDRNDHRDPSPSHSRKRARTEFDPTAPHEDAKDELIPTSDADELNSFTPLPYETQQSPRSTSAPPAPRYHSDDVDARSPERRPTLFDIGRASFSAGVNVLKKIVPGFPENANADEKQDFLEAVVQQRAEMKYLQEQLEKEREKVGSLKRRAEAAEERVHRREQAFLAQSSSLEEANEDIDRLFKEMGEMRELRGRYETRIQSLVEERGNLNKRLKSMQDNRAAQSKISLDPFKDQVDQVSEAAVKSGVESLNDSIDTFIMTLLDEAESVAARHSSSTLPSAVQNHEETDKLISALSQYSRSEEKRGFLLDANLHHGLVSELDKLFFSGDVLPSVMERRLANALLKDMSKHESWSVVQRWRALTATSGANFLGKVIPGSITTYAKSIVILLAWAYRQPLATFEPLGPTAEKRLQGLYDEAARLSLTVRRDILSVRMSIVAPIKTDDGYPPFDTRSAHTPWPDMGTETGDEVIGLYRFGLRKEAERAAPAFIVRPEVTTAVLLRFVAKE